MTETLFEPLFDKVIAPVNTLLCVKVIALLPAVKLEVPGTVNTPLCVIAPPAVITALPLFVKVIAGRAIAALLNVSVKLRRLVNPVKLGSTAPLLILRNEKSRIFDLVPPKTKADVPKSLACVPSKISEPDAVTATVVAPPVAVITPDSVILPPAVNESVLPTPTVPTVNALEVKNEMRDEIQ